MATVTRAKSHSVDVRLSTGEILFDVELRGGAHINDIVRLTYEDGSPVVTATSSGRSGMSGVSSVSISSGGVVGTTLTVLPEADWSTITNKPDSYPPSHHADTHQPGGDDLLTAFLLLSGGTITGDLYVDGDARVSGAVEINAPGGIAPLIIDSTTVVTNLNADMVDGVHMDDLLNYMERDLLLVLGQSTRLPFGMTRGDA